MQMHLVSSGLSFQSWHHGLDMVDDWAARKLSLARHKIVAHPHEKATITFMCPILFASPRVCFFSHLSRAFVLDSSGSVLMLEDVDMAMISS